MQDLRKRKTSLECVVIERSNKALQNKAHARCIS